MCNRNKANVRRVTIETTPATVMQQQQQFQLQKTFPFKLYNMLEYACNSEFSSCVSWSTEGKSFIIYDKEAMMEKLASMFFNQKNYRSFVSDLHE